MILDDLKGMRVLITGGSSGIGAAAAEAFARHGSAVAVHYNSGVNGASKVCDAIRAEGGKADIVGGDLTKPGEAARVVQEAAELLGGIDVLLNNAGGMIQPIRLGDFDETVFDKVLDLNVRSVLKVTHAALPHLKASRRGSIINVGSIAGRNGGQPGSAIYAMTKAAIHSLSRAMATEFAVDGIRVNTVAPGLIVTPFHARTSPERLESVKNSIPLKRLGTADDIAGAFLFFASSAMSGYVTGSIIDVNGGRLMT